MRLPDGLRGHAWDPPANFMALDPELSGWDDSSAVVLPVPYDATTSWIPGARFGPAAILEASRYVEWYDEELDSEPALAGICTLPSVEMSREGPGAAIAQLRALYEDLLPAAGERFVVAVGGEHSITSAPVTTWLDRLDGDLSILQFDAHADLRGEYHGTPWNHACVMRRILDHAEEGPGHRGVVAVGLRSLTSEDREIIRNRDVTAVFAHEMQAPGWVERALDSLSENVYVTFDLDFFDPAMMPATGTPEPGGGDWWDALSLLRPVFESRNVVGADVVELAPQRGHEASAFAAAKLVYKMIGLKGAAAG